MLLKLVHHSDITMETKLISATFRLRGFQEIWFCSIGVLQAEALDMRVIIKSEGKTPNTTWKLCKLVFYRYIIFWVYCYVGVGLWGAPSNRINSTHIRTRLNSLFHLYYFALLFHWINDDFCIFEAWRDHILIMDLFHSLIESRKNLRWQTQRARVREENKTRQGRESKRESVKETKREYGKWVRSWEWKNTNKKEECFTIQSKMQIEGTNDDDEIVMTFSLLKYITNWW